MRTISSIVLKLMRHLDRPVSRWAGRGRRGVALLFAIITIALLSIVAVEYSYSTRVNLSMSTHSLDKLRSYYHAKSGVNIASLLLRFQFQLEEESRQADQDIARIIHTAMRRSNFQIYQYMDLLISPFNTGKLKTPVGGINFNESGVKGFGNYGGDFEVSAQPEAGKLNVNEFARVKLQETDLIDFCALVADSKYDEIFEQKDEDGETLSRQRVLENIIDFVDLNDTRIDINEDCVLTGRGGREDAPYESKDLDIEPRDAKLTHIQELHQVIGVTEAFMRAFKPYLTVYPVGRPNLNSATFPIFYSVLCQNLERSGDDEKKGPSFNYCARNTQVRQQVIYFALALDGIRAFHSNPLSVLMAYVTGKKSRLLPSAKRGQPVAFRTTSQFPAYIQDLRNNNQLMARFIQHSPAYKKLAATNRNFRINPQNPKFPQWQISFDQTGLKRSVSSHTPRIYEIVATGKYGGTETKLRTVIDFGQSVRRLPEKEQLTKDAQSKERRKQIEKQLEKLRKKIPHGRILFWREK